MWNTEEGVAALLPTSARRRPRLASSALHAPAGHARDPSTGWHPVQAKPSAPLRAALPTLHSGRAGLDKAPPAGASAGHEPGGAGRAAGRPVLGTRLCGGVL